MFYIIHSFNLSDLSVCKVNAATKRTMGWVKLKIVAAELLPSLFITV